MAPFDDKGVEIESQIVPPEQQQPPADVAPPVGITPPQVLAQDAAAGRRGAAWRLLHWIMEDDPRAIVAVSSIEDDRLAQHLLEFIALGTWAGKPFVVPIPLRMAHARTRLRTLFLPGPGMDPALAERVLLSMAHDHRPLIREEAVRILGLIGSVTATPTLISALKDTSPGVRMQAAKALGRVGGHDAAAALLAALRTADEQMGSQIVSSLIRTGSEAVPLLIKESSSSSAWIRWQTLRALVAICDHRALPVLVQALRDSDHSIAWVAAKGLGRFGKSAVAPVLRLLMTTETSPWLVETSSYLLRELYTRDQKLKPYLEPVVQCMHGVAYQISTPQAARKALQQLETAGLIHSLA
jgi:HEAT repeat protein